MELSPKICWRRLPVDTIEGLLTLAPLFSVSEWNSMILSSISVITSSQDEEDKKDEDEEEEEEMEEEEEEEEEEKKEKKKENK